MKNKEKKHSASQLPNIYRFITETKVFKGISRLEFRLLNQSKHNKAIAYFLSFIVFVVVFLLLVGISALGIKLYQEINLYSKITTQRQNLQEKINFWQSFTEKYDGYKDAYFQIAILQYQLGNFEKANQYNKKALLLDPGFEDAKNLEVLLESK